ncbi:MAG: protein-L-isoaspartate(D-aspartate) O-methyltransferase [Euryarchaeota archaeon]|nr:protein-L-isoaspartate(D-aspartate) O-methyltransferase [Euryarchaeota archaeon]
MNVRQAHVPRVDQAERRAQLIAHLEERGTLHSQRVAQVMRAVPRELFVPRYLTHRAYEDAPIPIGHGQTISAPHMVAIMTEALELGPGQRVLEVGTGSGYQAAILSRLVEPGGRVATVERIGQLAERARSALLSCGAANVTVFHDDGSRGRPAAGPFDRIVVTAAAPRLPPPLLEQVAPGGILLAPVGARACDLIRARRTATGWKEENLGACAFVPLKGEFGQPA